jgi:two-component system sensor histidine kinase/response regulator
LKGFRVNLKAPVRIAIIDDDKDDYEVVRMFLEDVDPLRYETRWISSSRLGIHELLKQDSDVYIIDYRIDDYTGIDVMDAVQKIKSPKPMILLTSHGDLHTDLQAMERGAVDYLLKGELCPQSLERSIRYAIQNWEVKNSVEVAARLAAERETLERNSKNKSLFLASMAHEIRTPLTAILGYAELARDPEKTPIQIQYFMEIIQRNGDHLLSLVNDVLDISKIEAGEIHIESQKFNWQQAVLEVVQLLNNKVREKGLLLTYQFDELPSYAKGDRHRFKQVILNLVSNAIKFTESGEIKVLAQRVKKESQELSIRVIDSGIGISQDDQPKLFKSYSQGNESTFRTYGGTGLGLDISRKIARAMKGDLSLVSSQTGKGSEFEFSFPTILSSKTETETEKKFSPTRETCPLLRIQRNLKLLMIEDCLENQILLKHYLKDKCTLEVADDGQQGIKKAMSSNYDLILMDLQMPKVDGFQATERLRKMGCKIPIVALTASEGAETESQVLTSGFDGYLTKPIVREKLFSTLSKYDHLL